MGGGGVNGGGRGIRWAGGKWGGGKGGRKDRRVHFRGGEREGEVRGGMGVH